MIRAASRLSEIYRFGFWILIVAVVVGSIHYPPLIGFKVSSMEEGLIPLFL